MSFPLQIKHIMSEAEKAAVVAEGVEAPVVHKVHSRQQSKKVLRIPIRWRWTMMVALSVALSVVVLFFIILDIEKDAWLQSQSKQAALHVDRLTDGLKLPLLSGSRVETDLVVQKFLEKIPASLGAAIKYADGHVKKYKTTASVKDIIASKSTEKAIIRLADHSLWYKGSVMYANTPLAIVVVGFSAQEWDDLAGNLVSKISIAALLVVLCSSVLAYWMSGRASQPIEMLAEGARKVAEGDYKVRLHVSGNDEVYDAISQFNVMTQELAHKEKLRGIFGRYLNPEVINNLFDGGDVDLKSHRQEVTVLFADMVQFTAFS
ncbi:MAG: HAMP domain-containing protein, partial [Mariprofundus sp.]|nr:HAMP domain-containing protein [Mariprofundus sp.]